VISTSVVSGIAAQRDARALRLREQAQPPPPGL
jgi:hypothetical protein